MKTYYIGRYDGETFIIYAESKSQGTAYHIAKMYNDAYQKVAQDTRLTVIINATEIQHKYIGIE